VDAVEALDRLALRTIAEHQALTALLWERYCAFEGWPTDTQFGVPSRDNPFAPLLDAAYRALYEARRQRGALGYVGLAIGGGGRAELPRGKRPQPALIWADLGPLKAYLAGGAQRHSIDPAGQRKEMSRAGPSISPTFAYCRCGGRVLKHTWPGGKPGPQHAKKRWCSACGLADAELLEREFPGLAGAELNAALRRWQREEDLAGKQYQALLLLAGKSETAERYAPVVVDTALACVMRTLIAAQDRRAALAEAGQAASRHLLAREAATLASIVAPRHALPVLARLAGRHWVTLVGSKETAPAERLLAVTRLGREAVAESGGLDDGQQGAGAGHDG
jgi:hypothetical protein